MNIDAEHFSILSRLYSYPETGPKNEDLQRAKIQNDPKWGNTSGNSRLQMLQNSYVRLFINTLPEVPCPPYGSFYLEGTLMGPSAIRLKNMYHEYGFQTDEIPDHIAVELEFLALLATLASHVPVKKDYDFLLNHLRQWTPDFFKQVERNDDMGFYKEVSCFAQQVIFL